MAIVDGGRDPLPCSEELILAPAVDGLGGNFDDPRFSRFKLLDNSGDDFLWSGEPGTCSSDADDVVANDAEGTTGEDTDASCFELELFRLNHPLAFFSGTRSFPPSFAEDPFGNAWLFDGLGDGGIDGGSVPSCVW